MIHFWRITALVLALALFASTERSDVSRGDEPKDDFSAELPRIPPVEPSAALATFQVAPGFRIEQVAAEPLVIDPVAMAFDALGRLFVVEMRDYSEDKTGHLGRVRLLEDTDGDGRFDKSTVFVDNLSWPTAVTCYDGGVFIGAAPDILYCKDADGDGRADVVRKVFTGFGRSNVQGLLNTLTWGLDNRVHGATSSTGGQIRKVDELIPIGQLKEKTGATQAGQSPATASGSGARPDAQQPAKVVSVSGRDFAFDPRTLEFAATSGGAQHGMSFDDWGRKFVCSNSDHIQQVMFEDRYVARNPYLTAPSPRISIAADGPQAEVFRISPVEPWRIVRTRLRVAGAVPGPVEGGGRAAGYFTGATGLTIYRGDAWPAETRGLAVVGDVGSNLVHRKRLEQHGLEFVARRIDQHSELVASRDIWFRPAQFANAPDGTLYIADVYREVIEHPDSLPPVIKKHLDLTSGNDRGRIYRIVPDGFKQPPLPRLANAKTEELVATLENANGWQRETASRLLFERRDKAAIEPLVKLVAESSSPRARMHALYVLDGLHALAPSAVLRGLADKHPQVRRHAVRLAERVAGDSGEVRDKLLAMVADDDLEVRYQLAFTLGELADAGRLTALAQLARRDAANRWVRLAVLSSLNGGTGAVFSELVSDKQFRHGNAGRHVLEALALQAGLAHRDSDVAAVLKGLESLAADERPLAETLVRSLGEGLVRQGSPLAKLLATQSSGGKGDRGKAGEIFAHLLVTARRTATDNHASEKKRAQAVGMLALGSLADARPVLEKLLDQRVAPRLQIAALATLARFDDPAVAALVLEAWPGLSPRLRAQATELLFARVDRLTALLDAVEQGRFSAADIDPARAKLLEKHADARIRDRAGRLLASAKLGRRQDVIDAYRNVLAMPGDRKRGQVAFQKICAACHRVEGVGYEIGANLAAMKNRGAEAILVNVLDPSREVNPQYVNYTVVTRDGRTLTGMIAAETATSVTLKRGEGASDTVLRVNIDQMQSTGMSIMPEGLEKQVDPQMMADLIAYLMGVK
jgi:putative membrane-bound dehydrogenase-like protein